jgi:hypothetical protein
MHTYSREQAIADGVLVDITTTAKEAGFKVPIALTSAVYAQLKPSYHNAARGQSFEGRLWDVLMSMRAHADDPGFNLNTFPFDVTVTEMDEPRTIHLKAHIGRGDKGGNPVGTIMLLYESMDFAHHSL